MVLRNTEIAAAGAVAVAGEVAGEVAVPAAEQGEVGNRNRERTIKTCTCARVRSCACVKLLPCGILNPLHAVKCGARTLDAHPGFNVESVVYKNLTFSVWDLGGVHERTYTHKRTIAHANEDSVL